MGVYDTYGEVQIKVRGDVMKWYARGDKADIPDGIYIGREGAIVIKDGVFIMEVSNVFDKWGQQMDCNGLLSQSMRGPNKPWPGLPVE